MAHPVTAIPTYVLFGEQGAEAPAAFGHVETIAARSALHDWEISAHRHRHAIQVLVITAGTLTAWLDGASVALAGHCFVAVPAGAVHGFRFEPDASGWVLTLGLEFSRRAAGAGDPLARLLSEGGHGGLDAGTARRLAVLMAELLALGPAWQASGPFHALAEAALRSLPPGMAGPEGADHRRLALFRHLMETHMAEHRPVSFYARSIGVTERTLNRLVQRRLGCTPLEAVNRRLALEARRLLRHTNASVAHIGHELGFADPSYFSRFYLRMAGCRPAADRGEAGNT